VEGTEKFVCGGVVVHNSEGNLRRALAVIDALAKDSPVVVVIDEIDTIAREGLDGGTSSGMFAEMLTWLQESTSQAIVIATLNRLDKLDAALESRMQARFFFDLPSTREREAVCAIHYARLNCKDASMAAKLTADRSEGFSSRELAEHILPSVARLSARKPTAEIISRVVSSYTPASKTQGEQLEAMRRAASTLRRANDPEEAEVAPAKGRRIGKAS
jgi:SpoVK/Ycf46/Vps4 family AAA+-type ATPase